MHVASRHRRDTQQPSVAFVFTRINKRVVDHESEARLFGVLFIGRRS